jgi:hypothetical protein
MKKFIIIINDFRKKPFSPYMTAHKMLPVPCHGEYTENPLHDMGQGFITVRVDYEMNMIAHNAKMINLETVLLFSPFYDVEEEDPHSITVHDHLPSICPGGDMIGRAGLKNSVASHTHIYERFMRIALMDCPKNSVFGQKTLKNIIFSSVPN